MGDKVNNQLNELLDELRSYDTEREWFEFKENWFDQTQLGQYISALSNSAAIEGRKNAYFVWGIHNETHDVTGTTFNSNMDIKNEPLKHFLARQIYPDLNFSFEETNYEGKKVVVLTIPAARTVPTSFDNERFIRIGSSKESLRKYPEKELYLFDVLRHGFPTIENTPSKYQDLTFEKLFHSTAFCLPNQGCKEVGHLEKTVREYPANCNGFVKCGCGLLCSYLGKWS